MRMATIFFVFLCFSVYGAEAGTTPCFHEDDMHVADSRDTCGMPMNKVDLLLRDIQHRLELLRSDGGDIVYGEHNALDADNSLKELFGEEQVELWKQIDEQWFDEKEYRSFKLEKEATFQKSDLKKLKVSFLINFLEYYLSKLKENPQRADLQKAALYTYTILLDLLERNVKNPIGSSNKIENEIEKQDLVKSSEVSSVLDSLRRFLIPYEALLVGLTGILFLGYILAQMVGDSVAEW